MFLLVYISFQNGDSIWTRIEAFIFAVDPKASIH